MSSPYPSSGSGSDSDLEPFEATISLGSHTWTADATRFFLNREVFLTEAPACPVIQLLPSTTLTTISSLTTALSTTSTITPPLTTSYPPLPPNDPIVIKCPKTSTPLDPTDLHHESLVYSRLSTLQGRFIPRLFGIGSFDGKPALFIEYIPGRTLLELEVDVLADEGFLRRVREGRGEDQGKGGRLITRGGVEERVNKQLAEEIRRTLRELDGVGAGHGDVRLHNFIYCPEGSSGGGYEGRVVAIDLEFASFDDAEGHVKCEESVDELLGKVGNLILQKLGVVVG